MKHSCRTQRLARAKAWPRHICRLAKLRMPKDQKDKTIKPKTTDQYNDCSKEHNCVEQEDSKKCYICLPTLARRL